MLAPVLSEAKVHRLWHRWRMGGQRLHGHFDAEPLSLLASRLPPDERAAAVDEILAAYTPRSRWDEDDARVLGYLSRVASTERLTQALREMLGARAVQYRVLAELAPGLPETLIEEALQYALSADDDWSCRALAKLAPRLSGPLLNRAIAHVSEIEDRRWAAVALTALAQRLPSDGEHREMVLSMAVEAAVAAPLQSTLERVMADLIPQLPERLRPRAVSAAIREVCSDMHYLRQARTEEFDRLHALLAVLRGPEFEQLYVRLAEEVQVARVRAHALAAVIRQAGVELAADFFAHNQSLHHDWPGDFNRAGLMDLIAAAAWWINRNGGDPEVEGVIEAIFDVARWWP